MGSICMIYVKEKDLVVPGEILAEDDYYAGRGTFQENGKVCSNLLGLVSLRNKKISVIPLKSKYLPKKGDVVIGKIDDVRFSMWGVDINSPYPGILPASEVFGRDKKDLSRVFDIGDVLFLRIVDVDEVKKVKLGLKGRGMGKFKGGIIVDIAPTKVPRLIGKKGSMINMIKDKTGCKIVVGQNGLVWVKGKQDMDLLIDGEIPEEDNEEMEENFDDAFKKPELQDFREEAERELADEKAQNEEDFDDLNEDIDESEDDFEDSDDYEDGLDESEDDFDEDLEESEDDFDDVDESEDDLEEDEPESEDEDESEDEIVEEDEAESEEEIVDDEIVEEDEAESEEEIVDDEIVEEDEAESEEETVDEESEEAVDEESEESESVDLEEEGEEKPKESKFLDTFKHIKEQEKRNKSSFDLSRGNRKSPTLNISSNK